MQCQSTTPQWSFEPVIQPLTDQQLPWTIIAMSHGSFLLISAIVGFVSLAAAIVAWIWIDRRQQDINSSHKLFQELCKAYSLKRRQRRLLYEFVRFRRLTDPTQIFIDAELWKLDLLCDPRLTTGKTQQLRSLYSLLFQ